MIQSHYKSQITMRCIVKDRRKYRPFAPYLFFLIELVVMAELSYMYISILGSGFLPILFHTLILIYLISTSLGRMKRVLNRTKLSRIYIKNRDVRN